MLLVKYTLLALCALLSQPTWSGTFEAKIKEILVYSDGNLVYVYPEGGVRWPPTCHGSNGDYTSFNMSRPMAKEYLSTLLAVQLAGKTVRFTTAGTCIDQSMSDTLKYFSVLTQ